jgi:hypothetical protein
MRPSLYQVTTSSGSLADAASFTAGLQPALAAAALLSGCGAIAALGVTQPRLATVAFAPVLPPTDLVAVVVSGAGDLCAGASVRRRS